MADHPLVFTRSSTFLSSLLILVLAFYLAVPYCPSVKQRAWILTTISSAVMSLASLPLCWDYLVANGHLTAVPRANMWTYVSSRFFQAYLVADLVMGMLHYRSKLNILTGWIHHAIYVFIVEYAIRKNWSHIFCLCAIMEIPTFLLAVGSIRPRLRSDILFAVTFFVTRIVLHVALGASLVTSRAQVTAGSFAPGIIMGCIFPLHVFWFSGCIKGFLRRANDNTLAAASAASALEHPVGAPSTAQHPHGKPTATPRAHRADATPLRTDAHIGQHQRSPRGSGFARRRPASTTALRLAVRARWDQLARSRAGRRLCEVRRRLGAALPVRALVYNYAGYVGLEPGVPLALPLDADGAQEGLGAAAAAAHPIPAS